MNRRIPTVAAAVLSLFCFFPSSSRADDDGAAVHRSGGIGFHQTQAPLGVRWWLADQKAAVDIGVGFGSEPSFYFPGEHLKSFSFAAGFPVCLQSWSKVHVLIRPGVLYQTQQVELTLTPPFDTESEKTLLISGEIEAEAFLLENFSVSASTGVAYESFDPGFGDPKEKSFRTVGGSFTNVGFHVYMFH